MSDWVAPALVVAFCMLLAVLVISAGIAYNRHQDNVRRQAMITRRLKALDKLPGEITQVCPGGDGDHVRGRPAAEILRALRKERGEERAA